MSILIVGLLLSYNSAFAAEKSLVKSVKLNDLGVKVDPLKKPPPNLNVKSNAFVGECDGQKYTNPHELEGCERRVSARMFKSVPTGNQPAPLPRKNSIEE